MNMNRLGLGSTLLGGALLCAHGRAALAQTGDTLDTRSTWGVYVGYADGAQFVAGGQLQLRTPVPALRFVPEAAIAHGASLLVGAGVHASPFRSRLRPYAGLSLGYLWDGNDDDATNALVFTPKAGLLFDVGSARLMLEYQGVDWFAWYRILIGIRWSL